MRKLFCSWVTWPDLVTWPHMALGPKFSQKLRKRWGVRWVKTRRRCALPFFRYPRKPEGGRSNAPPPSRARVNSKRRGTGAICAEALLIDFSERAFISLRKSTFALFKFSLILLQSAIPRTLAKNANRDILPVCNRGDGRKWVYEISLYNFMKQKKWRNMVNYLITKNL